jgi:hypothetical protein
MRNTLVDTNMLSTQHDEVPTVAAFRESEHGYTSEECSEYSDCEEQFENIGGIFKKMKRFGRAKKKSNKYAVKIKKLTHTLKREIVAYNESTDVDIKANHKENIMGVVEEFRKLSTTATNVRDRLLEKYERNKGTWASTAKGRQTKDKNISERRKLDNVIISANAQITDALNTLGMNDESV